MAVQKRNVVLTVVLIALILLAALTSCYLLISMGWVGVNKNNENKADLTTKDIADTVISEMGYENVSAVNMNNIIKYYDIDDGVVADATVCVSEQADTYFEVSCFKLLDEDSYKDLETSINKHFDSLSANLHEINPKESEKLKNSKVEYSHPYVFVIVADGSDEAVSVFNNFVSKDPKSKV